MDPNATLDLIAEAETDDEQWEACRNLYRWLEGYGFAPDWAANIPGTKAYLRWCAARGRRGCDSAREAVRAYRGG